MFLFSVVDGSGCYLSLKVSFRCHFLTEPFFCELLVIYAIWSALNFVTRHGNIHNPILCYLYTQPHLRLQMYLRLVPNHLLLGIPWPGPLSVVPQSHRTATSLWSAKSARSPLITAGSLRDPSERRGSAADHSQVYKVAEVAAKFWTCSKQGQWGRRGNRSSERRSKHAQGARSIVVGSLLGYA